MKIISTITTDLHKKVVVDKLTKGQRELKRLQFSREAFMSRVHQTLNKNLIK